MSVDPASGKIAALASLMQAKKKAAKPFVVLLGAGASISSGVIPTERMMRELLDKYAPDIPDGDPRDRFDKLWVRSSEENRQLFLKPYLDQQPSPGYAHLVDLIRQGFISTIITFNFDNLVEIALMNAGLRAGFDYQVIVRGDYKDDRVVSMMSAPEPPLKVLKLHGSLRGGNTFLFSQDEMSGYPDEINGLVKRLTSSDIIICGYGFADLCVVRAFSDSGESIHCVNPSGAPPMLKGFLVRRHSDGNIVDGDAGKFDSYFEKLKAALLRPDAQRSAKPELNPFKFMDCYEPADKEWLFGRRALTRKVLAHIPKQRPQKGETFAPVVPIIGPAKVGKTSFVRAGVLPYLDPAIYLTVYTRCTRDLEQSLPETLKQRFHIEGVPGDIPATLRKLADSEPRRHVVLVLDQFERMVARYQAGQRELNACVQTLRDTGCQNLTVIPVGETDNRSRLILCLNALKIDYLYVPALEPRRVARIIDILGRKSGARFDPAAVEILRARYEDSVADELKEPFTLAHVQAICNLLVENAIAGQGGMCEASLSNMIKEHLDSLNHVINQCDVLSFIEDLPLEEQRALLCRILRIVAEPGRTRIAEYLRTHLDDLLKMRPARSAAISVASNGAASRSVTNAAG